MSVSAAEASACYKQLVFVNQVICTKLAACSNIMFCARKCIKYGWKKNVNVLLFIDARDADVTGCVYLVYCPSLILLH